MSRKALRVCLIAAAVVFLLILGAAMVFGQERRVAVNDEDAMPAYMFTDIEDFHAQFANRIEFFEWVERYRAGMTPYPPIVEKSATTNGRTCHWPQRGRFNECDRNTCNYCISWWTAEGCPDRGTRDDDIIYYKDQREWPGPGSKPYITNEESNTDSPCQVACCFGPGEGGYSSVVQYCLNPWLDDQPVRDGTHWWEPEQFVFLNEFGCWYFQEDGPRFNQ